MVWAICGRTPEMMQSAPISRIAVTVFSKCWATSVSTVGTPVMSMIAISDPVSTIRCSRDSMTIWVRSLSSVPIIGSGQDPVPELDHRRRKLEELLLLPSDHVFPRLLEGPDGEHPHLVQQFRGPPGFVGQGFRVLAELGLEAGEERLFEREDEPAVSSAGEALKDAAAGDFEKMLRSPSTRGGFVLAISPVWSCLLEKGDELGRLGFEVSVVDAMIASEPPRGEAASIRETRSPSCS